MQNYSLVNLQTKQNNLELISAITVGLTSSPEQKQTSDKYKNSQQSATLDNKQTLQTIITTSTTTTTISTTTTATATTTTTITPAVITSTKLESQLFGKINVSHI